MTSVPVLLRRVEDRHTPLVEKQREVSIGNRTTLMLRECDSGALPIGPLNAKRDIDAILWSMKLFDIRRYFHQRFWEQETQAAEQACMCEPFPHLETVAEHSWHVADAVLLLANYFPSLSIERCGTLAILHDKLEIITGDYDPLGPDGTGLSTHAFNADKQAAKQRAEERAIGRYLRLLGPAPRQFQRVALEELLEGRTAEARFVKAVDKLQVLAFIILKKEGHLCDDHLQFTFRYLSKAVTYFPGVIDHYLELRSRIIVQVARRRCCSPTYVEAIIDAGTAVQGML